MSVGSTIFLEDGSRNYFTLTNNQQYLRTFSYGGGWNQINIGMLCSMESTVTTAACGMFIGLVSSAQPGMGWKQQASLQRLEGATLGNANLEGVNFGNWNLGTDVSGSYFYTPGYFLYAYSGSTRSHAGYYGGPTYDSPVMNGLNAPNRKIVYTLGANKLSGQIYQWLVAVGNGNPPGVYSGATGTNHNHTNYTLCSALQNRPGHNDREIDGVSQWGEYTPILMPYTTADDLQYPLDTVCIYWQGPVALRIYQVAVSITS